MTGGRGVLDLDTTCLAARPHCAEGVRTNYHGAASGTCGSWGQVGSGAIGVDLPRAADSCNRLVSPLAPPRTHPNFYLSSLLFDLHEQSHQRVQS